MRKPHSDLPTAIDPVVRTLRLAVSAFSKPHYVSHVVGDHTSLLALIEKRFMTSGKEQNSSWIARQGHVHPWRTGLAASSGTHLSGTGAIDHNARLAVSRVCAPVAQVDRAPAF